MKRFFHVLFVRKTTPFGILIILATLVHAFIFPPVNVCEANSMEPPSILIIVPYAPDDMEISIVPDNIKADRINRAYESYFTFYLHDLKSSEYTVRVTTDDNYYDTVFKITADSYNNVYILDLEKGIFAAGIPVSRGITLIALRIAITLAVEGLVFWLFGYRKKRSWIIFLIINLITQGLLNILLNISGNPLSNYLIFILLFAEIFIILYELIMFSIFINEERRMITVFYVFCANIMSLLVGGFLITALPV